MIKYRDCLDKLSPYIPGRPIDEVKKEFNLDKVVKIASNENPYGSSPSVKQAVNEALFSSSLYPDGNCSSLREKLSEKFNIAPNNLVFGCGTDDLITLIGKAFIKENDECITAEISFSQYTASILAMGGKIIYSKMKNYAFDLDDIIAKITPKTKMIFIANPNNPTGSAFFSTTQEQFLKKVPKNILVVIDEAYSEFVPDKDFPDTLSMMKQYENVVLFKTFSKAYGLASFRVGYGIADQSIISILEKIRNPFNVSSYAQAAAIASLEDINFVESSVTKNLKTLEYLCEQFDDMKLYYIPTFANFIMVDVKKDSRVIFSELMKKGYIIRPGAAFGMDTFLRISIGTQKEMEGFIDVLKIVLN